MPFWRLSFREESNDPWTGTGHASGTESFHSSIFWVKENSTLPSEHNFSQYDNLVLGDSHADRTHRFAGHKFQRTLWVIAKTDDMVSKAIDAMVVCTEIKNIFFHECINDILVKHGNVVDLTPEPERIAALIENKKRYVGQLWYLFPNARILIGQPFARKAHKNITQYSPRMPV